MHQKDPHPVRTWLSVAVVVRVIGYGIIAAIFPVVYWLVTRAVWVTQVQGEGETIYRWSFWADYGTLLAVLVFVPIAWLLRKREMLLGCLLILAFFPFIIGLTMAFLALFMPHKYAVAVSPDRFEVRKGGFGQPERQMFRFRDLREVRLGSEWKVLSSRGFIVPFQDSYLVVVYRDGREENVVVGRLVEAALPDLLDAARERGVQITYVDR